MLNIKTQEQVDRLIIPYNYVLVKLERGSNEIVLNKGSENETKIYIPVDAGNQEIHAPIAGKVVKVCEYIMKKGCASWMTEIEVEEGDEVLMYYLSVVEALGLYSVLEDGGEATDINFFEINGHAYIFVKYEAINCIRTKEGLVPVNGYVLASRIEKPVQTTKSGIVLGVDAHGERTSDRLYYRQQFKVEYVGAKNIGYPDRNIEGREVFHDNRVHDMEFTEDGIQIELRDNLKPGDIVYLDSVNKAASLEYELHARERKDLVYFQRRFIVAILKEPIPEN